MYEIINETNKKIEQIDTVKKLLDFIVNKERLNACLFNVILVDNEYIHKINKNYRGIDKETDVISFALEDSADDIKLSFRVLGDIYISVEKAQEQALLYGHSFLRELSFLTVHGILHLLGYDHIDKKDEKIMFAKQEEILDEFGITK